MSGRDQLTRCVADAIDSIDAVSALLGADLSDSRISAFGEQFVVDVSIIDDATRAAFIAAAGRDTFAIVQRIWASDMMPRLQTVLDRFFGTSTWPHAGLFVDNPWPLLEGMMNNIARLKVLDPALTELVRLRGARQHDCRMCNSRRSVEAMNAGATTSDFEAIDFYERSNLPERIKAALALTDAVIWTPRHIDEVLVQRVRAALSDDEIVELVLDIVRNSLNKISVSLRSDAPNITDGVELFTTEADGSLTVVGTA